MIHQLNALSKKRTYLMKISNWHNLKASFKSQGRFGVVTKEERKRQGGMTSRKLLKKNWTLKEQGRKKKTGEEVHFRLHWFFRGKPAALLQC